MEMKLFDILPSGTNLSNANYNSQITDWAKACEIEIYRKCISDTLSVEFSVIQYSVINYKQEIKSNLVSILWHWLYVVWVGYVYFIKIIFV
jgi:hypothetical protein